MYGKHVWSGCMWAVRLRFSFKLGHWPVKQFIALLCRRSFLEPVPQLRRWYSLLGTEAWRYCEFPAFSVI